MTLEEGKHKRGYDTFMCCEEYSIMQGLNDYFCNGVKGYVESSAEEKNTCLSISYDISPNKYHHIDGQLSK